MVFYYLSTSHYWNIFPMCQEMVKLDQEGKQTGTKKLNLKFINLTCSHHRSARPTICFVKSQTLGLNRDISFLVNTNFTCLWKKSKLALFNLKWGIRYGIYADWINFPGKKLIASGCVGAFLIWSSTTANLKKKMKHFCLIACVCLCPPGTQKICWEIKTWEVSSFVSVTKPLDSSCPTSEA